jgi:hypothetical protein
VLWTLWSLRSDSWSWSTEEFFIFFVFLHHWWSLTSLVSATVVWWSLSATMMWSLALMVSTVSATSHVVDKLTPEVLFLFLIILIFFFSIDLDAWKWIAGENGWWK